MIDIRHLRLFGLLVFLLGLCVGIAATLAGVGRLHLPRIVQP